MTTQLARQRGHLITRAEEQRQALSQHIRDWRRPLEIVDGALAMLRYVKARPLLMTLPIAWFAFRRIRILLRWINRGWLAREVFKKLFFH
jgi:YqjK-like protein